MTTPVKIYQYPVSQPCRSIAWCIKLGNIPHENVFVDIFKGEHKKPEFLSKHRAGMIPMIETSSGVCTPESAAIMIYLCNHYGFTKYYPENEETRLKIHAALFAHSSLARQITVKVLFPLIGIKRSKGETATFADYKDAITKELEEIKTVLSKLESALEGRTYIADTNEATIADLLVACELNQIPLLSSLLPCEIAQFTAYPSIKQYAERVSQIPHHDEFQQPFMQFIEMLPKS